MDGVAQQIERQIFAQNHEKTFIDKLLSRKESEEIRQLIKKRNLKREELLEILYLISSTESKLLNFTPWDRYILLKFFVWVREFIVVCEHFYDYKEKSEKPSPDGEGQTDKEKELMQTIADSLEHVAKALVDLYLNIGRTSLSVNGTGFLESLKNKFEINYGTSNEPQQEKKGFLKW